MKSLESAQVKQLLEILQKKPAQRIVHFSEESNIITPNLLQFCEENENIYYLYCTNDTSFESYSNLYKEHPSIVIRNFKLERPRYLVQAIEFDYLLSTLNFEGKDKSAFLEKCYPIIRTGGNIILMIPNSGYEERDEWRDILEEQYYVSVNIIDDIFDTFDVIVAKRMHGWGN